MLGLLAVLLIYIIEQVPHSINTHFSCHLFPCVIIPLCSFYCINILKLPRDACNVILTASGIAVHFIAFGHTNFVVYLFLLVSVLSYFILFLRGAQFSLFLFIPVTAYYIRALRYSAAAGEYSIITATATLITFLTLFMKIFSLAHDTRIQKFSISKNLRIGLVSSKFLSSLLVSELEFKLMPSMLEYLGYIYSPANLLFGPFVSLKEHQTIMLLKRMNLERIQNIISSCLLSVVLSATGIALIKFSSFSTDLIIPTSLVTFIGIRCLKYSLNSLQELCLISSGTQQISSLGIFSPNRTVFFVSKPLLIELPRSFINIILNWNLPFFNFVRSYVYFPCHVLGRPVAATVSYILIGILLTIELEVALGTHYLSFVFVHALWSIFLIILITSLLAFCENIVRNRLAERLSLCIKSRSCPTPCEPTPERYLVVVINLVFTLASQYWFNSLGTYFEFTPWRA